MSSMWQTPRALYDSLNRAVGYDPEFGTGGFQVDAAANEDNHLHQNYYGPGSMLGVEPPLAHDALSVSQWLSPAFCNPPYLKGKAWIQWLDKFVKQKALGVRIVALLPAKVGTDWWHDYVFLQKCDVMFLTGRVPFELPGRAKPTQPNHESALVFYGPDTTGTITWIDWRPRVIKVDDVAEATGLKDAPKTPGMLIMPSQSDSDRVHDPRTGATHRLLRGRTGGRGVGRAGSGAGGTVQGPSGIQADPAPGVGGTGQSEV